MNRIEKLSALVYRVNGKTISMNDDGKFEPVNDNERLTFSERKALDDFIQCNTCGKIKLQSTIR